MRFLLLITLFGLAAAYPSSSSSEEDTTEIIADNSSDNDNAEQEDVQVRVINVRSTDETLHMEVTTNKRSYSLKLTKTPSIFHPHFGSDITSLEESLYSDPATGAVLVVNGDGKDTYVHGIVDDMVIDPVMNEKTRSGLIQHRASKITFPTGTGIYDYIETEASGSMRNDERAMPSVAYVELYLFVDSALSVKIAAGGQNLNTYLAVFWNGVQQRYNSMSSIANIKFMISGVKTLTSSEETFNTASKIGTGMVDGDKQLKEFSGWLYTNKAAYPEYDMAMLMTGQDMMMLSNGAWSSGLAGIAWLSSTCKTSTYWKRILKAGVSEDDGKYGGTFTAAHEAAHNLGAPHDGDGVSSGCSWDLGHIMSYMGWGTLAKYTFSSCSSNAMKNYIANDAAAVCLHSINIGQKVPSSSTLPGEMVTPDDVCKELTGQSNAYVAPGPIDCLKKVCKYVKSPYTWTQTSSKPWLDGTPCDTGKKCQDGQCK